ncbi:hypothetical protein F511_20237 [Dorcoceras hygrometricum]|uniref:Uncharacterized protein n=1 Tax=Dorcoceras hygrometricum TaxID=472368 RepID=A0A2Z7C0L6_9LAMI|nr:hypothetical protein F511_20237 [Dorcoceras hygrometricum]
MASSLFTNTLHVCFDSILSMDNPGMVSMFEALMASGLSGFLGCPTVLYEDALTEFFLNGSVRDGKVVSNICGKQVEISEELFSSTFELSVDGLTDLYEIPKDIVFDARSIFSFSGEQVSTSGKKREMKFEFRLLSDLLAKTISVKVGVEEVADVPRVKRTPVTKAVSRKRPAAVDEPIVKKKRIRVGKAAAVATDSALEAVPVQVVAPISTVPPPAPKRKIQKRKRRLALGSDDEIVGEPTTIAVEVAIENIVEEQRVEMPVDPVDQIIEQVIAETAQVETDVGRTNDSGPGVEDQGVKTADETELWFNLSYEEFATREANRPIIEQVIAETAQVETDVGRTNDSGPGVEDQGVKTADETELWFNLSYEEFATREANRPKETGSDVYLVETSLKQTEFFQGTETETYAPTADKNISDDESMTLEAIMSTIFDDLSLPSTFDEITLILFGKSISIPETDSTRIALQRKMYILTKYRELLLRKFLEIRLSNFVPGVATSAVDMKVLDMLSNLHLFVIDDLKVLSQAHDLIWEKPCCSIVFEGTNRDRGTVIARSNTNIKSTCWIRTMLRINGTWVIEPCADYWQQIPRVVASSIVVIPSRLSYVDTLPPVTEFFKLLKKRWADVCIEAAAFVVSGKLLPVGSLNFCRAIAVVQPVSVFGFQRPTVTSWGWSQLCTEFFRYSLFSGLLTVDFSISGSATILIRPSLGSANIFDTGAQLPHISFSPASVFAPDVQSITSSDAANQDVQMDIDQHGDSPDSSADSSLHFNANDISTEADAALDQFILPYSATDISASLAALRESFSKLVANQTRDSRKSGDAHREVTSKINHVERVFLDSLAAKNEAFRGLFKSIRQEAQNDNNALSLALKAVRAQNAILSTDLAATQKEVKDLQAELSKDFDDKLADICNDLLEFRVETQEQLASLGAHLAELIAFITKGSDDKRGEASSSRPQPPPDDQNRPSGGSGSRADDPSSSDSGGGSGGCINYGPYLSPKRDAEYWILGKRQF